MSQLNVDQIIAFTPGRVYAGVIDGSITQVGTGGLAERAIQAITRIDPTDGKNKVWAVDGEGSIIVDIDGGSVESWSAAVSSRGVGTFPQGCALIANYSGSTYIARQKLNPAIWYKSRTLNPLDFGFAAIPFATSPVAGAGFDGGEVGDAINALIPFSDDFLLFGCASSLYVLEGDPNAGGKISVIAPRTGVLGARAWTFDTSGGLYFIGSSGLFFMARGSFSPDNISDTKIDALLGRLNPSTVDIELEFDEVDQVVHIFLTPSDGVTQGAHVAYEVRGTAPWTDKYPIVAGPTSATVPSGDPNPENRRPWLGGLDGVIRRFDSDTVDDYGVAGPEAVECIVRFPVIETQDGQKQIMMNELQAFGSAGNDPVTWNIYAGESPEEVNLEATPTRTGTWFDDGQPDGFQTPVRLHVRGGALQLEIRQNTLGDTFGFERIIMVIDASTGGRRRRRRI